MELIQPMFAYTNSEVLAGCCQAGISPAKTSRLRSLVAATTRWDELIGDASWHGVTPLIEGVIREHCSDLIPPEIATKLRNESRNAIARNLALTAELVDLLALFEMNRLPAMALKGPALSMSIYGNLTSREFSDLDILVDSKHVPGVKECLLDRGYRLEPGFGAPGDEGLIHEGYQLSFATGNLLRVEIHWGVQEAKFVCRRLRCEEWWSRAGFVEINSRRVLVPGKVDLLLFLFAHGAKHGWERLKWICDIAAMTKSLSVSECETLLARAREYEATRLVALGFQLAREVLDAPVPGPVLELIQKDAWVTRTSHRIWRQAGTQTSMLKTGRIHFELAERITDKVLYCLHNAFVPTAAEHKLVRLPGLLSLLYFLVRPFRLLSSLGWRQIRMRT